MRYNRFIGACFFFSGATALVYEVLWVRMLALAFGNTVHAVGIVLAAFMSGLALGSLLLGRWADRRRDILRSYGLLELGIAVSALASPLLLDLVESLYLSLSPLELARWKLITLRYVLSMAVIAIPTTLMGGTLPILSRHFIREAGDTGRRLGQLYAVNTLGGIVGVFAAGFALLPLVGMRATLLGAVAVNAALGAAVWIAERRRASRLAIPAPAPAEIRDEPMGRAGRYAVVGLLLSGFAAMVYEVAWTRLLITVIGSATYSFSMILMGFLMGIALGSALVARAARNRNFGLSHFLAVELAIGVVGVATIVLFPFFPPLMFRGMQFASATASIHVLEFALVLLYVLVPTTLMGAAFPLAASLVGSTGSMRARRVGYLYAASTVGAIAGSLAAAFLWLPAAGSDGTIRAAAMVNIIVGVAGFAVMGRWRPALLASALMVLPLIPIMIPKGMLHTGVAVYGNRPGFSVTDKDRFDLFVREGLNATISVTADKLGAIALATNGKFDASTGGDMRTQLAVGYFPILLHPAPRDVLVIGFGSGVTMRAVTDFEEVRSIDCVEIEPAVFAVANYFVSVNKDVLHNPRLRCSVDDARGYLNARDKRYDVIISEPSNPWIEGVAMLFSKEFYELSISRLNPGGLFCQWVELYGLRPRDLATVLATFREVFPQATIWQPNDSDILLIGAIGDAPPALDLASFARRVSGAAGNDLQAYFEIREPVDFLSYYVTGPEGVAQLAPDGTQLNTDDRSVLEFNAPLALHENSAGDNFLFLSQALAYPPDLGRIMPGDHGEAEFLYRKSRNIVRMGVEITADWVADALDRDPANDDYRAEMASLKFRDGDVPIAVGMLGEVLGRKPDHARANFMMGLILKETDPVKAREYFERAASANPLSLDAALEAGHASLSLGEFGRAHEHFEMALGLPHKAIDHARMLFYAGYSATRAGAGEEGLALFARALDANPYDYQLLLQLSDLYGPLGVTRQTCMLAEYAQNLPIISMRKEISSHLPSLALCEQLFR